jgi:hypothetical protein
MSLPGRFEETGKKGERRTSNRRALRLSITARLPESPESAVTIHDLSESGILLETLTPLAPGQSFQILLPLAGAVGTVVVWNSGHFYGCQFNESVSLAAVSAALLQSAPKNADVDAANRTGDMLSQLRDVNARLQQVGQQLDHTIEELSKGRSGAKMRDLEADLTAALPRSPIPGPPEAGVPFDGESERYFEPPQLNYSDTSQSVVIISLILAGLAVLIFIAALLAIPIAY